MIRPNPTLVSEVYVCQRVGYGSFNATLVIPASLLLDHSAPMTEEATYFGRKARITRSGLEPLHRDLDIAGLPASRCANATRYELDREATFT